MPGEQLWKATLELIGLGVFASYASYLAFMEASTTVLGVSNWIDQEKDQLD
jgi:hypothetical protein